MSSILKIACLNAALIKPYTKNMILAAALPVIFMVFDRSLLSIMCFSMCMAAVTIGYNFSISEKNDMDRLYNILPVKKSSLVLGMYTYTISIGILFLVFYLAAGICTMIYFDDPVYATDISYAIIAGSMMFTVSSVFQLPGFYKYGSIKGRIFMYIPFIGLIILIFVTRIPSVEKFIIYTSRLPIYALSIITLMIIIVLYTVSAAFSIKIVKNKEI